MEIPTLAYSDSGFGVALAFGFTVGSGVAPFTAVPLTVVSVPFVFVTSSSKATIASGSVWFAHVCTEQY